ncbi:hypothetical protein [Nocardioides pantholopis]|uniref:hypothetical protein n=1 Tax=Nocardioides pantholopis TaxID=2483798 RepID=UPI000F08C2B3|nr:hypothetical protein [Nocardioides pantholopis]
MTTTTSSQVRTSPTGTLRSEGHHAAPEGRATAPPGVRGRWITRRWPTLLGIALGAVMLADLEEGSEVAVVLLIAALGYLATAALARPGAIWAVVGLEVAAVVGLQLLDVDPTPVLAVGAGLLAVAMVLGAGRKGPRPGAWYPALTLVFLACGVVGAWASPTLAGGVVGLGLLGHAAWDALHWRRHLVVRRSFAEWCGVLDTVLGVGVLLVVLG